MVREDENNINGPYSFYVIKYDILHLSCQLKVIQITCPLWVSALSISYKSYKSWQPKIFITDLYLVHEFEMKKIKNVKCMYIIIDWKERN